MTPPQITQISQITPNNLRNLRNLRFLFVLRFRPRISSVRQESNRAIGLTNPDREVLTEIGSAVLGLDHRLADGEPELAGGRRPTDHRGPFPARLAGHAGADRGGASPRLTAAHDDRVRRGIRSEGLLRSLRSGQRREI